MNEDTNKTFNEVMDKLIRAAAVFEAEIEKYVPNSLRYPTDVRAYQVVNSALASMVKTKAT